MMKVPTWLSWLGLCALWLAPAWAQPASEEGPPERAPASVGAPVGLGGPGNAAPGPGAASPGSAGPAPAGKDAACRNDCRKLPGALTAPPDRSPKCQPPAVWVREVRIGLPRGEVFGGCDEANVSRQVRKRASALRVCAQRLRAHDRAVAPEVTLTWVIGVDGKVQTSKASAKGPSAPALERCLEAQARRWLYEGPAPTGVCTARWTLTFETYDDCRGKPPASNEVPLGGFR